MQKQLIAHFTFFAFSLLAFSLLIGTAFAVSEAESIPNGIEVSPDIFPGVVSLEFDTGKKKDTFCTGAVVTHHSVLTAAHCGKVVNRIAEKRKDFLLFQKLGIYGAGPNPYNQIHFFVRSGEKKWEIKSATLFPNSIAEAIQDPISKKMKCADSFRDLEDDPINGTYCIDTRKDVAVISGPSFPDDYLLPISSDPPKPHQRVTLLGYGMNDLFLSETEKHFYNDGHGKKRIGSNVINSLDEDMIYLQGLTQDRSFLGLNFPSGEEANIGPGDSGGPLLSTSGKILGIASAVWLPKSDGAKRTGSKFVRTDRAEIKAFILSAISSGTSSGTSSGN